MRKIFYIYIIVNWNNQVNYIGLTSDLTKRIYQHKNKVYESFSKRYNISKLVYFETFDNFWDAFAREKQLKSWRRERKYELIRSLNPEFRDLYWDLK